MSATITTTTTTTATTTPVVDSSNLITSTPSTPVNKLLSKNGVLHEPFHAEPVSAYFIAGLTVCSLAIVTLLSVSVHFIASSVPWWTVLASWYVCNILAIITHWAGHVRLEGKYLGWWYRAHIGHHINDYPPSKFISETYENAKEDNSQAYIACLILTPIIVLQFTTNPSVATVLAASLTGLIELKLADILHMGFHQRGFYLEGKTFGVFENLRNMHYFHHKGSMKHNYAVADFYLDVLLLGVHFSWDEKKSN